MSFAKRYAVPVLTAAILFGCAEGQDSATEGADTMATDTAMQSTPAFDDPMSSDTLRAALTGADVVPGPGDPDGSGEASVAFDMSAVCYTLSVAGIAEPTAAHIHRGGAGESGPPVVNFDITTNGMSNCVPADEAIIDEIRSSPSDFYVNVHNSEFGAGAVRGQLTVAAAPGDL